MRVVRQIDSDLTRRCVPDDVGQSFLDDAEGGKIDGRRQRPGGSLGSEVHIQTGGGGIGDELR